MVTLLSFKKLGGYILLAIFLVIFRVVELSV